MDNTLILIFAVSALLGAALLQVILAIAGYRSRSERRQRDRGLRALQEELLAMNGANATLARRISLLEQHLSQVTAYQEENTHTGPIGQAYEVAVNLVRKGTDVDELVSTCGLSRGEAELIMRLYGAPAARDGKTSPARVKRQELPVHTAAAAYEAVY
jgi:hypothetical protein